MTQQIIWLSSFVSYIASKSVCNAGYVDILYILWSSWASYCLVGRGTRLHLFAQAIQQWVQNGGVQNLIMQVFFFQFQCVNYPSMQVLAWFYEARARSALRALGLLLADGTPTVGGGKTYWRVSRIIFTETAETPERKVEKSFPWWEINQHAEG